ncbi:TetR/AcrR family transcriptional regulator [Amycolatopsis thermophila]|uniref:AcrR family transcriptional regulator n=1 Tax=Amycolatopsis thermophila TaxID=206084 RepID=A0ABU0F4H1_9PSEU|nr:TetR/AcrR family transcriptional regulator [Amycolatopsis thermophila]MDQ0381985.1 AcrR family transcriptional regulator [Amycolatopsis thermophila]
MPKLWNETIEAHRHQVRDAILDATAALVFEHGLRSVTMAQIAEKAGIGRATLYKYFPDVDAILHAWHHRQITTHLTQLTEARDTVNDPGQRLEAVLQAYARIAHQTRSHHNTEIGRFLHRDEHLADAQQQLHDLVSSLIADAAQAGDLRADTPAGELAAYCLHALNAAGSLPAQAAVDRLVAVTLAGLRVPSDHNPV